MTERLRSRWCRTETFVGGLFPFSPPRVARFGSWDTHSDFLDGRPGGFAALGENVPQPFRPSHFLLLVDHARLHSTLFTEQVCQKFEGID